MIRAEVATQSDSAELCRLIRQVPLPGALSLAYGRDPDYFAGLDVEGRVNQVAIVRSSGVITTAAIRSIRRVYVDGHTMNLGYLHALRTLDAYRKRGHFARGFLFVRSLHDADKLIPAYLMTVIDDNTGTREMFTTPRKFFPRCFDFGRCITYAMPLHTTAGCVSGRSNIEHCNESALPELLWFLNTQAKERQFAPVYSEEDFRRFRSRNFSLEHLYIYREHGSIAGTLGIWDQASFKQSVVHAYNGWLRGASSLVNIGLTLGGFGRLPSPGEQIPLVYACCLFSDKGRVDIVRALLDHAISLWNGKGYQYLLVGFHERDPLRKCMKRRIAISYASRLYLAGWEDGWEFCEKVSRQPLPFLEIATL
jgi:hypothetical protein